MGWPVEHSRSPVMHRFWLREHGVDGEYVLLPVPPDELPDALRSLPARGFAGCNLTLPHKPAALALLDEIEPEARRIGAVNTVIVGPDGSLAGRNTDTLGFLFAPRASRVAVLAPASYSRTVYADALRDATGRLGFTLVAQPVEEQITAETIERSFVRFAAEHADVVIIPDLSENIMYLQRIVELSFREKLPTLAQNRQFVTAGALMSYAADPVDLVRRAVAYADRILKGERPGDLPFYRASRYELIINRKTAEKLNLSIPPILEATADEIIGN
jgi:hypothetical protein